MTAGSNAALLAKTSRVTVTYLANPKRETTITTAEGHDREKIIYLIPEDCAPSFKKLGIASSQGMGFRTTDPQIQANQ